MLIRVDQLAAAQFVEVFVGKERRLPDPLAVEQAKATVERRGRWSHFFEEIGIGPVAHGTEHAFARLELLADVGGAQVIIVNGIA